MPGIASPRIYPARSAPAGGDTDRDRVDVVVGTPGPPPAATPPRRARPRPRPPSTAATRPAAMTRPTTYLLRMVVFLVAVLVVAGLLSDALLTAFSSNPLLNTLILLVLLSGIAWNIVQVTRLAPEVSWLEAFQTARDRLATLPPPRLLAPMASMLAARQAKSRDGQDRFTLSAPAMRSLLDSLASRLDESRELSRYMTGLLIFLGLLGTFWGLLLTVGAVSDVIGGMSVGSGDLNALFEQLKSGLGRPLRGMGTAFSSSMFGLAGALVLGFLDLTAGQAQNRFFNELEEWLAGLTRLSSGALGGEGETSVPLYVQALLEQTAENMENLQSHPGPRRGWPAAGEPGHAGPDREDRHLVGHACAPTSSSCCASPRPRPSSARRCSASASAGGDETGEASRGHLRNIELLSAAPAERDRAGPPAEHLRTAQRHPRPHPHHRRHRRGPAGVRVASQETPLPTHHQRARSRTERAHNA